MAVQMRASDLVRLLRKASDSRIQSEPFAAYRPASEPEPCEKTHEFGEFWD